MKKIFYYALHVVICALLFAGCGNLSVPQKKLIVGMDESPIGTRDANGEFVGFEVDLARETAKRMNVAIEFKMIRWDEKEQELNSGNIDMIWNGMDITPERKGIMLFSKPYMDNRQIIMVRKGEDFGIRSVHDLENKVVGAKAATTSAFYIENNEKLKQSLAEFKTYTTDAEVFEALKTGMVDALVCDEIVGRVEMIRSNDKIEMLNITVGKPHELGIGFRKNDIELRNRVQKAYDEIVKDGTAKKISEKWFQADILKR